MIKLIDYPVDLVGAAYPHRRDPLNFSIRYDTNKSYLQADPQTGLLEVEGLPAGFLRCSRAMLEKMIAAYPELECVCAAAPNGKMHTLFSNIHEGEHYYGEDYSFCMRWHRLGGQVWVDPEIEMGHIGYKTFIGSLGDWLRNQPNFNDDLKACFGEEIKDVA